MVQILRYLCFRGVMCGSEVWARSMSSLAHAVCSPATPNRMKFDASVTDMAQRPVQQTYLSHDSYIQG
jgi:hypothetical protein